MTSSQPTLTQAAKLMGSVRSERKHAACIESLKKARAAQARKRAMNRAWKQAQSECEGTVHRPEGRISVSETPYNPIRAPFPKHSYLLVYQWLKALGTTGISRQDLVSMIHLYQRPWNAAAQMRQVLWECRKRGLIIEQGRG